jgi:hypothetical protein
LSILLVGFGTVQVQQVFCTTYVVSVLRYCVRTTVPLLRRERQGLYMIDVTVLVQVVPVIVGTCDPYMVQACTLVLVLVLG